MANVTFLPSREPALVTWSTNFNSKINLAPTTYGLTTAQGTAYTGFHNAFVTAFNACNSDATNSRSATVVKNAAKATLIANARLLAGIVQKFPGTTNAMRSDLGLTLKDTQPTPVPPPGFAPSILVVSTAGNTVRLRFVDPAHPTRRGKPGHVDGIAVFSHVGPTAPTQQADWTFEGNTSRTSVDVAFPADSTPAGATVWFTAFYFNQRKQNGPAATPVSTNVPGGAAMAA